MCCSCFCTDTFASKVSLLRFPSLSPFLPHFLSCFLSKLTFFAWKQLQCSERIQTLVRSSCLFSQPLMCVAGPHIPGQATPGSSLAYFSPVIFVVGFYVSYFSSSLACSLFLPPLLCFTSLCVVLYPGSEVPLHSSGTFCCLAPSVTLFTCKNPTQEVQPSQHIYCFSSHFNLATS